MDSASVKKFLIELQEQIVTRLEQVDGEKFIRDSWVREANPQGSAQSSLITGAGTGGGVSCILEEGNVLERGGVAFSHVHGDNMPA